MESLYTLFKVQLPKYLRSLPLPKNFAGFASTKSEEWFALVPFFLTVTFILYAMIHTICSRRRRRAVPKPKVNLSLMKEDPKVVTQMDIEDLGDKIAFCRCWRSKKFPLCDGSHNQHNEETKDNVGPLLLRRGEEK
uniref:CDGSH iron-sulfur domain-containing protein 2 homologue n=1 Tax=Biomphalaria glabrata TaxID=6526 RepID=A0A2C9LTL3_BIOGL